MLTGVKTIIILARNNGVGLTADAEILLKLLSSNAQHRVEWWQEGATAPKEADMYIHLEILYYRYQHKAKFNVYIPNPEWFDLKWQKQFPKTNFTVLAKTVSTKSIFQQLRLKTIYTGFTSLDRMQPASRFGLPDKERSYVHFAGQSLSKGTAQVIEAFSQPGMPELTVYSQRSPFKARTINVTVIKQPLTENDLCMEMHKHRFHLCTSSYEGWGHYINEAKSVGAVIITTNEPPMNEMVTPEFGYGCSTEGYSRQGLAILKHPSAKSIAECVRNTMQLTDDQVDSLSLKTRLSFEKNDREFRKIFPVIINNIFNGI